MDNKGTQFEDLAQRISGLVGELPNDGQERQMTVTIGGDNHGDITFGNHITIHAAPGPAADQAPPSDEQLREMERQARTEHRDAVRRSWVNVPFALMVLIAGGTIFALVKGYLWQLVSTSDYPYIVPGIIIGLLMGLSTQVIRIKRLEQPIIRESEETLEMVQHLRHRQRVARR